MISFFHPTSKNTGYACSFSQNSKDGTIFAALLKQDSWDTAKHIGGFLGSRGNPDKHVNIKLNATEVSAILDSIDRYRIFSTVHTSDKDTKSINFGLWLSKPDPNKPDEKPQPKGYSFSITLTDKEDSTRKISWYIGLTFAESRLIREFLIYALNRMFEINEANFLTPDAPKKEGKELI
jgi:hypothetical protein